MSAAYDAIIIGAGPAGSSAAILLARAGWSVALLEASSFPRRKVCGECIAASNLPLLDALGVGEALRRCAGPELQRVALWQGDERITAALPAGADGNSRWGRALGREHLDLLLLERARAAGATVFQPCRALAVRGLPCDECYEVDVAASGAKLQLRAPVIIRAHGSWQAPPGEGASWVCDRRASDLLGFKASFRGAALDDGLLPVLAFAGGYGGMVIASDGLATLACCIRRDSLAASRCAGGSGPAGRAGEAVEALLRRECRGVREALEHASRAGPWLAAGPIRPGVRLRPRAAAAFSSATRPARSIPSSARASAWRCNRPGSCARSWPARQMHCGAMRAGKCAGARFSGAMPHGGAPNSSGACASRRVSRTPPCVPAVTAPLLPLLRRAPALLGAAARASGKTRSAVALAAANRPVVIQGSPS